MATHTPMHDSTNAISRKQRKVRQSCNTCSSQKIRCGKQRPKCSRCTMKGLCCEYGMSMRTGERPRVIVSPIAQREDGNITLKSPKDVPISTTENTFTVTHMDHSSDQSTGTQLEHVQDDIDWVLQSAHLSTVETPEFGLITEHDDVINDSSCQSYGLLPTPSTKEYNFNIFDQDNSLQSFEKPRATRDISGSIDSRRSPSIDYDVLGPNKIHDCTTEALMLIADFHVLATGCLTTAKDLTSGVKWGCHTDDTPKEIGTILSENRKSLKRLDRLLDCGCSSRQDVLVLIYLAISKAVEWYAAMLGSGEDKASQEEDNITTTQKCRRIARTTSFMGSYSLDRNAQRLISAHLVLTQLKDHVYPFLKRLRQSHPSTSMDDSPEPSNSSRHTSSVIEHHHIALTEQVDRISARASSIKHT